MNQGFEPEAQLVERDAVSAGEIIIGELLGLNDVGEPQVFFSGAESGGLTAMSTVVVTQEHIGRQVALLFANGDLNKPVIMGLIYSPLLDILKNSVELVSSEEEMVEASEEKFQAEDQPVSESSEANTAYIDGTRVVLEGKEEITLKCGEASITLTKAGKVLIRGKYLLNRSSGVNRIMGGSVQVN